MNDTYTTTLPTDTPEERGTDCPSRISPTLASFSESVALPLALGTFYSYFRQMRKVQGRWRRGKSEKISWPSVVCLHLACACQLAAFLVENGVQGKDTLLFLKSCHLAATVSPMLTNWLLSAALLTVCSWSCSSFYCMLPTKRALWGLVVFVAGLVGLYASTAGRRKSTQLLVMFASSLILGQWVFQDVHTRKREGGMESLSKTYLCFQFLGSLLFLANLLFGGQPFFLVVPSLLSFICIGIIVSMAKVDEKLADTPEREGERDEGAERQEPRKEGAAIGGLFELAS